MNEGLSVSSVSPKPALSIQEAMASSTAQPTESIAAELMESLNLEVPQLTDASEIPSLPTTGLEATRPEFASPVPQLFSISPVPSPSAINFEDK